jgi:hypothetical protein
MFFHVILWFLLCVSEGLTKASSGGEPFRVGDQSAWQAKPELLPERALNLIDIYKTFLFVLRAVFGGISGSWWDLFLKVCLGGISGSFHDFPRARFTGASLQEVFLLVVVVVVFAH